jgi:biopolymer transport protein ExbB/TolQ
MSVLPAFLALLPQSSPAPRPRGFVELFQTTGFVGPLILVLAIVALVLAIRRWLELASERLAPESLQRSLEASIRDGRPATGLERSTAGRTCLGTIVAAGLDLEKGGLDEMLANVERAAIKETLRYSNRIANLGRLGVVVLLIGLFGSVLGLMSTMAVLGRLSSPGLSDFAAGTGEALTCTALGLAIALPCFVAHFLLENRLARRTLAVREIAEELVRAAAAKPREPAP